MDRTILKYQGKDKLQSFAAFLLRSHHSGLAPLPPHTTHQFSEDVLIPQYQLITGMDPMWYSLQYYCNLSCGGGSVMVAMRLFQSPQNSFLTPLYYLLASCGNKLFSKICCHKKRSNSFTLKEGRFKLDTRKKCLILRGVRHCRFPERW